jgi:CBS domain-containing protein
MTTRATGQPTTALKVKDVMTREPLAVSPSMTLRELAQLLDTNEISGVPVVDTQDHVIGVVSKTDLIHRWLEGEDGSRAEPFGEVLDEEWGDLASMMPDDLGVVEDIMSPDVVTATEDEPISAVARRMAEVGVHRIIVTDERGFLHGIVTSLDLLKVFPE